MGENFLKIIDAIADLDVNAIQVDDVCNICECSEKTARKILSNMVADGTLTENEDGTFRNQK